MNNHQVFSMYPVHAINVLIYYSLSAMSVEITRNFAFDFRGRRIEPFVTILIIW